MSSDRTAKVGATALVVGLVAAALALFDPGRRGGFVLTALVAGALAAWLSARGGRLRSLVGPGLLVTLLWGTAAWIPPHFRADSQSYYAQLRSLALDGDLDLENEWARWGYAAEPAEPAGRPGLVHSVGPALLWSPFFGLAHLYVTVLGGSIEPDGYGPPYVRSTSLGTLFWLAVGSWLLGRTLAARYGRGVAVLAVAGSVVASPTLHYAFVAPAMAHGLAFGAAAALIWAADRALRRPSLNTWSTVGALLGVVTVIRWQGLVLAVPLGLLALDELRRHRVRVG